MEPFLYYIANVRIPTEKAHGIQIMKTCEAFNTLGVLKTLIVPYRRNTISDDPFKYYAITKTFPIKKLPAIDLVRFDRVLGAAYFWVGSFSFLLSLFFFFLLKPRSNVTIYTRDTLAIFLR